MGRTHPMSKKKKKNEYTASSLIIKLVMLITEEVLDFFIERIERKTVKSHS